MEWHREDLKGVVLVKPRGAINHNNSVDIQALFEDAVVKAAEAEARLVIDFSAVDYISSVGLRALMHAGNLARAKKVEIALAGLNDTVTEIFQIARFHKIFPIFATVAKASEPAPT
jgi:anti-anti-sigma factor